MTMPAPLPEELFATLSPSVQAYIGHLEASAAQLSAQVATLTARVADLEAKLRQDSSNSSRPPSSDGPRHKRRLASRANAGEAPSRATPSNDRTILPPDRSIDHRPPHCQRCRTPLSGDDPGPIIDRVIDLPEVMRHVTHHRRHTLACPRCRARTTADRPFEAASGFGPELRAATAYFGGVGRLGKRAIGLLFSDLFDLPMALGSVSKLEARTGDALGPIHDEASGHTRGLDANVDETSWRQGREKSWLWVAVTASVTVFLIRRNRNQAAFDDLVGTSPGVLTTDRFAVYAHLPSGRRQACWAHLRRDFRAMIDRRDRGSPVGEDLLMYADILAEHWREAREGDRTREWFVEAVLPWPREEVGLLLGAGSRLGRDATARVCRDLLAIEPGPWTFASRAGVEPTNNAAERAVRHAVCWRETSYGTDSERGSRFVERMLTVVASCRSQGRNVMSFLMQAITAHRSHTQTPSILPAGA